jgi:DNA modification methylase
MSAAHIRDLAVTTIPIGLLKPNSGNPRTHSRTQIKQIAKSLTAFGWTNPILIDGDNNVIAGHGRLQAARLAGYSEVPVIAIGDMTAAQKRAYMLADNKLAENAGWDRELLALELGGLVEMDLDFEISATGFEMGEIDLILNEVDADGRAENPPPDVDLTSPPLSQTGDLWQIGPHHLLCGDGTDSSAIAEVLDGASAQMVFTDPPYNVPINGHVSGSDRHAEFAMASGEMSETEFTGFLERALHAATGCCTDGALAFVCMDWRHIYDLLTAARREALALQNLCVWTKTNAGMGSLYRSQHELIAVFKKGTAPHVNNVQLGRFGRNRSNVWSYPGMNTFGAERDEALAMHPTVKPVGLVEDAILDCSNRGDLILDPFVGSGTTLVAAARSGRRGCGVEIDPRYVDVSLRRLRAVVNAEPINTRTGVEFGQQEARSKDADRSSEV